MSDIVSPEKRSAMMSGIRGKDTQPEVAVRKALFAGGFRYRLHNRSLPGSPDIVLAKYRVAVLVHGCFWHMHKNCKYSRMPSTRFDFWTKKLTANAARDQRVTNELLTLGWRVMVIWECHVRASRDSSELQVQLSDWIRGNSQMGEYPIRTGTDSAA